MNVKIKLLGLACWLSAKVWAVEFPYLLQDPLLTRPPEFDVVTRLQGDGEDFRCIDHTGDGLNIQEPLALHKAVDLALCNSPQAQLAWIAIKAQAATLGEARAAYLPTLNATVNRLKNDTRYPDGSLPNSKNSGKTQYINFTWRLFDSGTRSANLELAQQLLAAAFASHNNALLKVLTSVIGTYFEAHTAQAASVAREQAMSLAQETLQRTLLREAKGVAAANDVLQARSALAKAHLAFIRAQGEVRKSRAVLLYAMGLDANTPVVLQPNTSSQHEAMVEDLAQWLQEAQARHPAITAARAQWLASQAKVQAAKAEGLPTLDLTHNFYQNGFPNQGLSSTKSNVRTVGITLNLPLFEGFVRTYKVKGAMAQSEQAQTQLRETEFQILTEVVKAHADAQASLMNLQASQQLLEATQLAVKSSQNRYEKGVADILELLSAQSALVDAQQERVRYLSDWRSARLKLMVASGQLGRAGIGAE